MYCICCKAKYIFIQDETSFNCLLILALQVHLIQIFIELFKTLFTNSLFYFTGRIESEEICFEEPVHNKYLFVVQQMARAVAQCLLQVLKHLS